MSFTRQVAALLLLVVAIVATLTHVCMLPVHDAVELTAILQVETPRVHGSHQESTASSTRHTDAHLAHASACSATAPTGAPSCVPPAVAVMSAPDTVAAIRVVPATAPVLDGSPRLFLLHAALLI